MKASEREKLKAACKVCRDIDCPDKQLLLVPLEDVEELLKVDETIQDMLEILKRLEAIRIAYEQREDCEEKS